MTINYIHILKKDVTIICYLKILNMDRAKKIVSLLKK